MKKQTTGEAAVAPEVVSFLERLCSANVERCGQALRACGGDVDRALGWLIQRGEVTAGGLNPRLATDAHYAMAGAAEHVVMARVFQGKDAKGAKFLERLLSGEATIDQDWLRVGKERHQHHWREWFPKTPYKGAKKLGKIEEEAASPEVARLGRMTGVSPKRCEAVLKVSGGNAERACRKMIVSGEVGVDALDAKLVSDELFAVAEACRELRQELRQISRARLLAGPRGAYFKRLQQFIDGKVKPSREELEEGRAVRESNWAASYPKERRKERKVEETKEIGPVEMPPLPKLKWVGYWEGKDVLRSWKGFQARGGPYTSRSSARASGGKVSVQVMPPDGEERPPARAQVAAYRYLKENDDEVRDAVLDAVWEYYDKLRDAWGIADSNEDMPEIDSPEDLRRMMGVGTVFVLDYAKGGVAYIGFECGCTWDEEHGVGIVMHKGRVVGVEQADIASDGTYAEGDGGKQITR